MEYSFQKIKQNDINSIIKGAKRIEQLINLSNNNYLIVDMFPNLEVNFFKSTSINVAGFECWLKIVELGTMISGDEGQKIYLKKKNDEHELRENNLREVYAAAHEYNNDPAYDVGSPRYFPMSEEDSPRYYPTSDDDPMDEDNN